MSSVRRERQLGWFTRPEFPHLGRLPDEATVRADLEAGLCPFCEKGPYIVPLGHVSRMHGVDRWEMRRIAGVGANASLCDETYSAKCAQEARESRHWRLGVDARRCEPLDPTNPQDSRHGRNGYINYGCRCEACREAWRIAHHDYMSRNPQQREKNRLRMRDQRRALRDTESSVTRL